MPAQPKYRPPLWVCGALVGAVVGLLASSTWQYAEQTKHWIPREECQIAISLGVDYGACMANCGGLSGPEMSQCTTTCHCLYEGAFCEDMPKSKELRDE